MDSRVRIITEGVGLGPKWKYAMTKAPLQKADYILRMLDVLVNQLNHKRSFSHWLIGGDTSAVRLFTTKEYQYLLFERKGLWLPEYIQCRERSWRSRTNQTTKSL
jgi:hypothetical protein